MIKQVAFAILALASLTIGMYAGVGSTGRGRLDRMAEHRAKRVFERRLDRDLAGL